VDLAHASRAAAAARSVPSAPPIQLRWPVAAHRPASRLTSRDT